MERGLGERIGEMGRGRGGNGRWVGEEGGVEEVTTSRGDEKGKGVEGQRWRGEMGRGRGTGGRGGRREGERGSGSTVG